MFVNYRRTLSQTALVVAVLLFSASVQTFAFTSPTAQPPNGDAYAPLNTGLDGQIKSGNLQVNALGIQGVGNALLVPYGNVVIGTSGAPKKLSVVGTIEATGEIRVGGSTALLCSSQTEGTVRYDASTKNLAFCNGTAWMLLTSTTAAPTPTPTPAPCGTQASGTTWTGSCPSPQSGTITYSCTNGTTTQLNNNCANPCGSHASGTTWTGSCSSPQTGTITYSCSNGVTTQLNSNCANPCGSRPSGSTWSDSSACGSPPFCWQGAVTYSCMNGTVRQESSSCRRVCGG